MEQGKIITQKDFEKKRKKELFGNIDHLCTSQRKLLSNIKEAEQHLNAKVIGELPNIGITFNNKIVELSHNFEDAGISIFSQTFENYGSTKSNFISTSFIGDSIIFYMLDKIEEAVKSVYGYYSKLTDLIALEQQKCNAFYSANPIKKFSLVVRSLVSLPPELDFSCTQEDINELNNYALTYIKIDTKLWKSTLKELIVPCLVAHIERTKQTKENLDSLLNENVIPYLEKLGLSDLVPELKKEIKKSLDKSEICIDEDER